MSIDFHLTKLNQSSMNIPGLIVIENYIPEDTQKDLISNIRQQKWENLLKREVQHYIRYYDYRTRDSGKAAEPEPEFLKELLTNKLISDGILPESGPEQIIINKYEPGEGIGLHTDAMVFGDPVVTLSLGSAADFVFSRSGHEDITYYLKPGTLVIMSGPARYYYKHTIPARLSDTVNGEKIPRSTRISVTYRLMAPNKWKVKLDQ